MRLVSATIPASAGIGLRFPHHQAVAREKPAIGWVEVHTENYMGGGAALRALEAVRRDYPVSLHGVGLSLGTADGLNSRHLGRIRDLDRRIEAGLVSEHLSWSIAGDTYLGDLLPLPMTEEALEVVSANVARFQEALGRRMLIENPSSYLRYRHSTIPEWEFLAAVVERTGCGVLLDINNVFVSSRNHGWDATAYLEAVPVAAVGEFHLAGHSVRRFEGRTILVDDHGSPVREAVWELYAQALRRFGPVPTLVERDNDIPPLADLVAEAVRAQALIEEVRHADAA
jgi:uncharacterized protein (UPF0276 family)